VDGWNGLIDALEGEEGGETEGYPSKVSALVGR